MTVQYVKRHGITQKANHFATNGSTHGKTQIAHTVGKLGWQHSYDTRALAGMKLI
jgi:hypothetical protein